VWIRRGSWFSLPALFLVALISQPRAARADEPGIEHVSPAYVSQVHDLQLRIKVHAPEGATQAFFFARAPGSAANGTAFKRFAMRPPGSSHTVFEGTLPKTFLKGASRVEYYFVAYDAATLKELHADGHTSQNPYSLPVALGRKLTISTQPPGAAVMIDGKAVGKSPLSGTLGRGAHRMLLQLPGHKDLNIDLWMPEDRDVKLDQVLASEEDRSFTRKGSITLNIETDPPGLPVSLDGRQAGVGPLRDLTIDPGEHEITLQESCTRSLSIPVKVSSGGTRLVYIAAEPKLAVLAMRAVDRAGKDIEAKVEIQSGSFLANGVTPQQFVVPVCHTQVAVTAPNGNQRPEQPVLQEETVTPMTVEFRDYLAPPELASARQQAIADSDTGNPGLPPPTIAGYTLLAVGAAALLSGVVLGPVTAVQQSTLHTTYQAGPVAAMQLQTNNAMGNASYALWGAGAGLAIPGTVVVILF
jgi:hypothetical protein